MRTSQAVALGLLLASVLAGGAVRGASAQDSNPVELILTEEGSETPGLDHGDLVTLIVPDLEEPTVAEVPEGLFVEQSGTEVIVEPGGSTFVIDEVDDGAYPVAVSKQMLIPLVGTINVSSTKKPR